MLAATLSFHRVQRLAVGWVCCSRFVRAPLRNVDDGKRLCRCMLASDCCLPHKFNVRRSPSLDVVPVVFRSRNGNIAVLWNETFVASPVIETIWASSSKPSWQSGGPASTIISPDRLIVRSKHRDFHGFHDHERERVVDGSDHAFVTIALRCWR